MVYSRRLIPLSPCCNPRRDPMLKEFKEFIARANVIDLAIGVIIGLS